MVRREKARTFAGVLTGSGRGAIAVVRVWGDRALDVVDGVFRPARGLPLSQTSVDRPRVGRIGAGRGDEVVVFAVDAVGGTQVEIQCHGGSAATALVLHALRDADVRIVRPERWLLSQGHSRIQAEALWSLERAETARTAAILHDQSQGVLDAQLSLLSRLALDESHQRAAELLDRAEVGLRLLSGWRVVLAGRPNVGKSRLLNALAGFERSIVDPTPGTTRDVVNTRTAFDGWPVELGDTAGLRPTHDAIESLGIDRARAVQAAADLVILVLDRSEPATSEDRALLDRHPRALVVANKSDLPAAWDAPGLPISAERGDGIEMLVKSIAARLVPTPPVAGDAVPFRPWQVRWLRHWCERSGERAPGLRRVGQ